MSDLPPSTIKSSLTLNHTICLFLCIALLLSQVYAELDRIVWLLPAFVLIALALLTAPYSVPASTIFCRPIGKVSVPSALLSSSLILFPLLIYLGITWSSDFPYGGDHVTHIGQAFRTGVFWADIIGAELAGSQFTVAEFLEKYSSKPKLILASRFLILLLILGIVTSVLLLKRYTLACLILGISIVALSFIDASYNFRWPTLSYFLSMPWTALAISLGWDNLWNGIRLYNTSAIIFWLLILRPYCVGSWPNFRIVPFCLFFFWLPQHITIFTSVYLESWSIVLLLTAIEAVIRRKSEALPIALLLMGAASLIKEPAILALPIIYLLGKRYELKDIFQIHHKQASKLYSECLMVSAVAFPFLSHVLIRHNLGPLLAGTNPAIDIRSWSPSLNKLGSNTQIEQLRIDLEQLFGFSGAVLLIVLVIFSILLSRKNRYQLFGTSLILLGGVGYMIFFGMDSSAPNLLGYPRFFLWPLLFGAILVLMYFTELPTSKVLGSVFVISVVLLLIQAPKLIRLYSLASAPSSSQNFSFYKFDPILFPIKDLLDQVDKDYSELPIKFISNRPDPFVVNHNYGHYEARVTFVGAGELHCECTAEKPAIMLLTVSLESLPNRYQTDGKPSPREKLWDITHEKKDICLVSMRASCGKVYISTNNQLVVGALGINY